MRVAAADPIHDISPPDVRWSRNNAAEAIPGVLTPLAWAFFGRLTEVHCRQGFCDLGLIPSSAVIYPDDVADRMLGIFHGRWALNAQVVRKIMCALPGVTGDEVERDILGYVPEGETDDPYPRRLPAILTKAPRQLLHAGRDADHTCTDIKAWWQQQVGPDGPRAGIAPRDLLRDAMAQFGRAMALQARTRMLFQGASAQLIALAERAGTPDAAAGLLSGGAGLEETDVADDLWLTAQGTMTLAAFLARHGYHGPGSGNLASRSWREAAGPVAGLLPGVRGAERPADRRARAQAGSAQAAADVIARLPARSRPGARVTLRLAPRTARNLERTKTAFLVALDGGRAAARAIGDELVRDDRVDDREDVFYLLPEELLEPHARGLRDVVAERRAARRDHSRLEIPETWTGQPVPVVARAEEGSPRPDRLTGAGVSPGTIEGRVRVVIDPSRVEAIELGEILVAPTTDPSWVSLMTIAGALVVDIGTAASHSAIVARELGIPCVIGTKTGTRDLRDGDRVRVDGARGTVDVLD